MCLKTPKRRNFKMLNLSVVLILTFSAISADFNTQECGKLEHRCDCGTPACINLNLVNNGVQDCQDGSDEEGQWDPSHCEIKNKTSEDIRFKNSSLAGRKAKGPLVIKLNLPEQRLMGGRLFVEPGRNLETKIMGNGVEVIVKGLKTGIVNLENGSILPTPVPVITTQNVITLPPSTVSNQFHLVDNPHKPNTAIDHLLHFARSATPELITKTLFTTFTLLQTVVQNFTTTVSSREETISNVITKKSEPSIEYTPLLISSEPTTISPQFLNLLDSSHVTQTLSTTYSYFNTFIRASLSPLTISSTEIVSNVVTVPAYLKNSLILNDEDSFYSPLKLKVRQTGSYVTTFEHLTTGENGKIQTLVDTLSQIVVTEGYNPVETSHVSKTYFTTYTTFLTTLDGTNEITQSSTHIVSNVVTENLQPVMIYATKTYFTTTTYLTSILGENNVTKIQSRTSVVSQISTEAISTVLNADKLLELKSSYLAQISNFPDEKVQSSLYFPHRPKDEEEGILDRTIIYDEPVLNEMKSEIHHIVNVLSPSSLDVNLEILPTSTQKKDGIYPTKLFSGLEFDKDIDEVDDNIEHFIDTVKETTNSVEFNSEPTPPLDILKSKLGELSTIKKNQETSKSPSTEELKINLEHTKSPNSHEVQSVYINNILTKIEQKIGTFVKNSESDNLNNVLPSTKIDSVRDIMASKSAVENAKVKSPTVSITPIVFGSITKPIGDATEIFQILSQTTTESHDEIGHNIEYYDENKEESVFKEHYEEYPELEQSKIYTLEKFKIKPSSVLSHRKDSTSSKEKLSLKSNIFEETTQMSLEALHQELLDLIPENVEKTTTEYPELIFKEPEEVLKFSPSGTLIKIVDDIKNNKSSVTTKRPLKSTTKSPPLGDDYEDSVETNTKIYNLVLGARPGSSDSTSSGEKDLKNSEETKDSEENNKKNNKKEEINDDENLNDDEESSEEISNKPPRIFMPTGEGPSKNNLGSSGANQNGEIITVSNTPNNGITTTSGINWKPLLNLGAIGLGGLGASTLTKLSPLFSSMAGYLKSGLLLAPIARNDTQNSPNLKYDNYYKPMHPPDDTIPRRPIFTHANEPNFKNGENMNNFMPPNDKQPNFFSNEREQSSNLVKVISGSPINAMPVNRSPAPHIFNENYKRRNEFSRPNNWGQKIILPMPPQMSSSSESDEKINIKNRPNAQIVKIRRPNLAPGIIKTQNEAKRPKLETSEENSRRPQIFRVPNENYNNRPHSQEQIISQNMHPDRNREQFKKNEQNRVLQSDIHKNFHNQVRPSIYNEVNNRETSGERLNFANKPNQSPIRESHENINNESSQKHILSKPIGPFKPFNQNSNNYNRGPNFNQIAIRPTPNVQLNGPPIELGEIELSQIPYEPNLPNHHHKIQSNQNNKQNIFHVNQGQNPNFIKNMPTNEHGPMHNMRPHNVPQNNFKNNEQRPMQSQRPTIMTLANNNRFSHPNNFQKRPEMHNFGSSAELQRPQQSIYLPHGNNFINRPRPPPLIEIYPTHENPIMNQNLVPPTQDPIPNQTPLQFNDAFFNFKLGGTQNPFNPSPPPQHRPHIFQNSEEHEKISSSEENIAPILNNNKNQEQNLHNLHNQNTNFNKEHNFGPQRFPFGQGLYEIIPSKEHTSKMPQILLPGMNQHKNYENNPPTLSSNVLLPGVNDEKDSSEISSNEVNVEKNNFNINPTASYGPNLYTRSSTVYIVEETYEPPPTTFQNSNENNLNIKNENNDKKQELIIKEITTLTSTTTTTKRPMFVRKSTISTTTSRPSSLTMLKNAISSLGSINNRTSIFSNFFLTTTPKPLTLFGLFPTGFNISPPLNDLLKANSDKKYILPHSTPIQYFSSSSNRPFEKGEEPSGSESNVAILDPISEQIVNASISLGQDDEDYESEENVLNPFLNYNGVTTPKNSDLWWPSSFRPQNEDQNRPKIEPTTYRNILRPTTFRPRRPLLSSGSNRVTSQLNKPLSSIDDENEGIENIKLKNVEIHKRPGFIRRPILKQGTHPVFSLIPNSFEDEENEENEQNEEKIKNDNIKNDKESESESENENYDYPATKLRPPAPPQNFNGQNMRQNINQRPNNFQRRPIENLQNFKQGPPPISRFPNNLIHRNPNYGMRRPNPSSDSVESLPMGNFRPQIPQNNMLRLPFPINSPDFSNSFNKIKPIPLNPSANLNLVTPLPPPPKNNENSKNNDNENEEEDEEEEENEELINIKNDKNLINNQNLHRDKSKDHLKNNEKLSEEEEEDEIIDSSEANINSNKDKNTKSNDVLVNKIEDKNRPDKIESSTKSFKLNDELQKEGLNKRPILNHIIRKPNPNANNEVKNNQLIKNSSSNNNNNNGPIRRPDLNKNGPNKIQNLNQNGPIRRPFINRNTPTKSPHLAQTEPINEPPVKFSTRQPIRPQMTNFIRRRPISTSSEQINASNEQEEQESSEVLKFNKEKVNEPIKKRPTSRENIKNPPKKVEALLNRPIQIGGFIRPKPQNSPPQREPIVNLEPNSNVNSNEVKFEPPPIDSHHHKESILELHSIGPTKIYHDYKTGQNLLRPTESYQNKFQIIASVDDDNKIIATNVIRAPIENSAVSDFTSSESIKFSTSNFDLEPSSPLIIGSVETVALDLPNFIKETPILGSTNYQSSSVLKYSSGSLKTLKFLPTQVNKISSEIPKSEVRASEAYSPFIPIKKPNIPPWRLRTSSTTSSTTTTKKPMSFRDKFKFSNNRGPYLSTTTQKIILESEEEYEDESVEAQESSRPNIIANKTQKDSYENNNLSKNITENKEIINNSENSVNFANVSKEESNELNMMPTTFRPQTRPTSLTHPENVTVIHTKNGTISVVSNKKSSVTISSSSSISTKMPNFSTSTFSENTDSKIYVTHSDTSTTILTETEITILPTSVSGVEAVTKTVIITSTVPPQTLISTIYGSVTLVNALDITPTVVRTTIYSEPTQRAFTNEPDSYTTSPTTPIPVPKPEETKPENKPKDRPLLNGGIFSIKRKTITTTGPLITPTISSTTQNPLEVIRKKSSSRTEGDCAKLNCSIQGNQICRNSTGAPKCGCKAGYARMKNTAPCRPTFTYEMKMLLSPEDENLVNDLKKEGSESYSNFLSLTKEGLESAFLMTDIKRQFQGADIVKLDPVKNAKVMEVDFLVQLTVNMTEDRIKNHLIRTLKASNFSIGNSGMVSSKNLSDFSARDFDECSNSDFNDCSSNAECINIRGSFTCKCKSGFKDRSKKHKPGRDCNEITGCSECNFKGNCYVDKYGNTACDCFKWYGGAECTWNLKILLMSIIGVGGILFFVVLFCGIFICKRNKRTRDRLGSGRFMRYRSPTSQATLERTAIMHDSGSSTNSSESGQDSPIQPTRLNHQSFTPDSLVEPNGKESRGILSNSNMESRRHNLDSSVNLMNFSLRNVVNTDQDRSLAVVIPRAKIRPNSRPSSRHNIHETPSCSTSPQIQIPSSAHERKLLSYLESHSTSSPTQGPSRIPISTKQTQAQRANEAKAFRKLSLQERRISTGALVSSGTEVSARGGMRRRSTGLEPDIPKSHSSHSAHPHNLRIYEKTPTDMRSYDETTVRSHAKFTTDTNKSRQSNYSCKPPSYCGYSESHGHTMAEKDGASTVYTMQGKLFRLTNDSDSNISSD